MSRILYCQRFFPVSREHISSLRNRGFIIIWVPILGYLIKDGRMDNSLKDVKKVY